MREEASLIVNYVPTRSDSGTFESKLKYLDSDVAAIDQQANELLSQLK